MHRLFTNFNSITLLLHLFFGNTDFQCRLINFLQYYCELRRSQLCLPIILFLDASHNLFIIELPLEVILIFLIFSSTLLYHLSTFKLTSIQVNYLTLFLYFPIFYSIISISRTLYACKSYIFLTCFASANASSILCPFESS